MADYKALQAIFDRLEAGKRLNQRELQMLVAAVRSQQITIATGDRAVAIGGNAEGAVIVTGHSNIVLKNANAEAVQQLLKQPTDIPENLPRSGIVHFVGREHELEILNQQLQQNAQVTMLAIIGMGGLGKTELALQYALKHRQSYQGGICWLQARGVNIGIHITQFAQTHLQLNLPGHLDLPSQVSFCWHHWPPGEVLIIIDDVTEFETVKPYIPGNKFRFKVLITTRRDLGKSIQKLELKELNREASKDLLIKLIRPKCNFKDLEEIKITEDICQRLGYLPLAIELAGRFLSSSPDISLLEFKLQLEQKGIEIEALQEYESDMTAQSGLTAALELSWQDLDESVKQLGCLLGLFGVAPISWLLIEQTALSINGNKKINLAQFKRNRDKYLVKRHLLKRVGKGVYKLHNLIRDFFRQKLNEQSYSYTVKCKFCQVVADLAFKNTSAFVLISPHVDSAIEILFTSLSEQSQNNLNLEINEDPIIAEYVSELSKLAGLLIGFGYYEKAKCVLESCNQFAQNYGITEHIISSLNGIGWSLGAQGDYERAREYFQQGLAIAESINHPMHIKLLEGLGWVEADLGNSQKATAYFKQGLKIAKISRNGRLFTSRRIFKESETDGFEA